MMQTRPQIDDPALHLLQSRLGTRVASALSAHSTTLPHDIGERLRFAREQALAAARNRCMATAESVRPVGLTPQGTLILGGSAPWWQRALGVMPLIVLVCGLVLIERLSTREQVLAAADIDAVLLADTLPPAAYSDPGFVEFLRSAPP